MSVLYTCWDTTTYIKKTPLDTNCPAKLAIFLDTNYTNLTRHPWQGVPGMLYLTINWGEMPNLGEKMQKEPVVRQPFTYSFAELIDKLSIVSKKDLYNLPGDRDELNLIMSWLNTVGVDGYTILSIIRITQANSDIWNLEHQLRNAVVGEFPENVAGRIAEKVRDHNKTRVRYMNELNHACGDSQVI